MAADRMSVSFAESPGGSKPSVAELASFAKRGNEIAVGGVDDITELGDDMGISLLANSKIPMTPERTLSIGGGNPRAEGGVPQLQINPVADLDIMDVDVAPGVSDIKIQRDGDFGGGASGTPFTINTGLGGSGGGGGGINIMTGESMDAAAGPKPMSAEDETREKQRLLSKLRRLESDGVSGKSMNMNHSLDEIKAEHDVRTDSKNLEASIRFQRNALMTFVSGVEMLTEKKSVRDRLPVKPRLKGWSESVHTNIGDFDDIFEELYDLYKDKTKMHPLLRLVGTLGVSATMYHLTNNAAEQSGIPGMSEILHEDPELQRLIAQRMAARMGGIGQFMAAAGGMGGPGPAPMGMGIPRPPSPPPTTPAGSSRVPFNMAAAMAEDVAAAGAPRVRREMRGPTGVDDVLKAFETERLMQAASAMPVPPTDSVFTPSGPPPAAARGVSVLRAGVGTPTDPLADLMADDLGSVGSGGTNATERRRGRPRRPVATPVGATLDLNV